MDINTNFKVICLDNEQYQKLLEMAGWGAKENDCVDRLERIERHVSKYNESMPRELAERNRKRVEREQDNARRLRAIVGSEGRGKTYYVTGRWEKRKLFIPVTIVGRGELLPLGTRQIVVKLVDPTSKLMKALAVAHHFSQSSSLRGTVFSFLRPIKEAILHMHWSRRQRFTTDSKPYFNVSLYHLIDTLPEDAVELSYDVRHGTVDFIFSGCFVGPEPASE